MGKSSVGPFFFGGGRKTRGKARGEDSIRSIYRTKPLHKRSLGGEKSGGDKDGASYLPSSNFPSWLFFFRGENGGRGMTREG